MGYGKRASKERTPDPGRWADVVQQSGGNTMNNIIWLIGAVVVVIAILSFLGLR